MANHELTLANLDKLEDGRIAVAFDQALKRVIADCMDRPGDSKPRTLTLEIAFVPVIESGGDATFAKFGFQIKDKLPTRKSKVYMGHMRRGGHIVFNDLADDAPAQRSLDGLAAVDDEEDLEIDEQED